MAAQVIGRGPFVGRETPLGALTEAMAAAELGENVLVLVAGEPGIGKTRLVTELESRVSLAPIWAACWEGDGAPAYWPWRQLLGGLAEDHRHELAAAMARVDLEQDATGRDARFDLVDTVADGLARVSLRTPLMLVLDDLQWADEESIRLLQFLAADRRPRRLALVGTYRDTDVAADHPLAAALPGLVRHGLHVVLGGLGPRDVAALAAASGHDASSEATVAQLHRHSGGNPFFLSELLRLGRQTPPPSVRAAVQQRLALLAPAARDVLVASAVLAGEGFVTSVAGLMESSTAAVLAAARPAVDAGLIELTAGAELRFVHDLVRQVVHDGLDVPARAEWHRRAAQQLQREGDPHAAGIAHHLFEAALHTPDEQCLEWALRAADQASQGHGFGDAAHWYQRALTALPPHDPREPDLVLRSGAACLAAGRMAEARSAYKRAAALARVAGDTDLLAHAALGLGGGLGGFEIPLLDGLQIDLLEEALAARGDQPSSLRAWLLARLSVALSLVADDGRRRDLSADAVAVARAVGDPRALGYALAASCDAMAGPDDCEHRVRAGAEIVDLGDQAGDRELELLGLRLQVVALLEVGDVGGADRAVERYALVTERLRAPLYRWYLPLWRGTRALMRGELDAAARWTAEAEQLGELAGSGNAVALTFTQWWVRQRHEGHVPEAGSAMATLLANPEVAAQVTTGPRAVVAAMTGDLAKARVLLAEWLASGLADRTRDSEWLPESAQLAQVAVAAGAVDVAERLYADLGPYGSRYCVEGIGAAVTGSVSWYLAQLAGLLGRNAEAGRHAEHARVAHARIGLVRDPPPLASGSGAATATPPTGPSLVVEGVTWAVTWQGTTSRARDSKGLRDLARLLTRPHTEVHCVELIGGSDVGGDTGPALDERARRAYEQRIRDLQADIDEATELGDLGRAERAEAELDALVTQLARAYGLSGRSRTTGSAAERARSAVGWRIRAAIRNLGEVQPDLARHLRNAVRTGAWCSYRPETDPGWVVQSA